VIEMPRLTIRARLTLMYGGLFLAAGILLLVTTYLLVSRQMHGSPQFTQTTTVSHSGDAYDTVNVQPSTIAGELTDTALDTMAVQGGIAMLVISATVVTAGWMLAGRLLQPLHRVTGTARRIADAPGASRGLHERIGLRGPPDELKELADTFDDMLERLDHAFDAQRRFIANASHELRTPLTLNRALIEVAVQRPAVPPEVRQLGDALMDINSRHERLIDGLLTLAQSERDLDERSYVDLADVAEHVVAQLPAGEIAVHIGAEEAPTLGSPVLLERMAQNLVENALHYNLHEGGFVRVEAAVGSAGTVQFRVINSGPLISRYQVPGLFEPFRRLGQDRLHSVHPGAGLGLSIVRAVARAHGGDVAAVPREGGGLTVTVTLPHA
jgi:signal transduction histidine kinase